VAAEAAADVTNAFRCSTTARDGNLWVLQQSRLLKLQAGRIFQSGPLTGEPRNLWDLFEDGEGMLWASSYESGLYRISPTGAVEQFTMTNGLSYDALRFVFQDRERNLWIGSSGGGLMRLRPRTFLTFDTENLVRARVLKSVWRNVRERSCWEVTGGAWCVWTKPGSRRGARG
jgi:ligand-binding sensor domain-containing protein